MTEQQKQRFTSATTQATDGLWGTFLAVGGAKLEPDALKAIVRKAIIEHLEPADVLDMAVEHLFSAVRLGVEQSLKK